MLTRYCCSRLLGPSFADVKQLTVAPLRNQDQSPANRNPNKINGKEHHNIFLQQWWCWNRPCHWTRLSRTREKLNPHFHNTNPTHGLPF